MNGQTVRLFQPSGQTLWRGIHAYLEHLAIQVKAEQFGRDNFANRRATLTGFGQAWYVWVSDGRSFLVPQQRTGDRRHPPLLYGAADEAEAIAKAQLLADTIIPGSSFPAAEALAVRNGSRNLEEFGNDDLSRWLIANPTWTSGHTKTNVCVAIVECFAWFDDEHKIPSPFKRRRVPKFIRPARRAATDSEYVALMRHGSRALRRVLWTLYNVDGIRTCEQREMLWSDFDWDAGIVLTYKHKTARKTGKPRVVPLTPRQLRFFRNLHRQRGPGFPARPCKDCGRPAAEHVFLNTDGSPWTRRSLGLHLRRTARRIGLDDQGLANVTCYCFRHLYATQSDEAGVPEQDTIKLMGHTGTKMLRGTYSKASRNGRHMVAIAEKTEKLRREARRARNAQAEKPAREDPPMPLFDGLE